MSPSNRRFAFCILLCCITWSTCGGGGSGGSSRGNSAADAVPTLLHATFVGAGPLPAAGDKLHLFLSEDVTLESGRLVDDLDLELSGGPATPTLGNVISAARLHNPRTVELTLGAGVDFAPGVTSIDFTVGNDSVTDRTGNSAEKSIARTIQPGDGDHPSITSFTLSGVDATLNGTGPAGGTLQVPTNGFTIDLEHGDSSSAVNGGQTVVAASVVVDVNGTNRQAGVDIADAMTVISSPGKTSLAVPSTVTLPDGDFELTAYVFDSSGMVSAAATFRGRARTPIDALRPFETTVHASQVWFIDTSRDIESFSVNVLNFITPAVVHDAPNDRPDLEDILTTVGLLSANPIPNVSGTKDSNEVLMDAFRSEILNHLNRLFDGANIVFTFTRPAPWPGGSQIPYHAASFSQISLAGSEHRSGTTGLHGVAIFNPNNTTQEDDTLTDFGGSQRLGVFLHTVVNDGLIGHPTTLFRTTFDPFTPARYGTPIGEAPNDGLRLTGALDDGRTTEIILAVQRMADFTAVVLAHECGHSVGLVANGPMPRGLYGNDADSFPVFPAPAADGHIKMPASLFPGISENIMTPGFDFDSALAPDTQFNSLNRAYLRERVVVDGN